MPYASEYDSRLEAELILTRGNSPERIYKVDYAGITGGKTENSKNVNNQSHQYGYLPGPV